jgi:hypothetical protein
VTRAQHDIAAEELELPGVEEEHPAPHGFEVVLANGLPHEPFLIGDDGDLDLYRVDVGIADEALDVAPCAHG